MEQRDNVKTERRMVRTCILYWWIITRFYIYRYMYHMYIWYQRSCLLPCHKCAHLWLGLSAGQCCSCSACRTKGFFQENNVDLLVHPACSPYVNPIEKIWEWMARKVYKIDVSFRPRMHLMNAIFTIWSNFANSFLKNNCIEHA